MPEPSNRIVRNSGREEWVTPPPIIASARAVMTGIDLDPASSPGANEIVQAQRYYTAEDDGLYRPWYGRVWLNPPYRHPTVGKFINRLLVTRDDWDQAMVLVNNATETAWGQRLLREADAVCFPRRRVRFWQVGEFEPTGPVGTPLQGQMIAYFAPTYGVGRDHVAFFQNEFRALGIVR